MNALFDIDPPALIYRGFATPDHKKRCRDCHQVKPFHSGFLGSDESGKGCSYVVCRECSRHARGLRARVIKEADQ